MNNVGHFLKISQSGIMLCLTSVLTSKPLSQRQHLACDQLAILLLMPASVGWHYDHPVTFLTLQSEVRNLALRAQVEKEASSILYPRGAVGMNSPC